MKIRLSDLRKIVQEALLDQEFAKMEFSEGDFEIDVKHLKETMHLASEFINAYGKVRDTEVLKNPWIARQGEELLKRIEPYKEHDRFRKDWVDTNAHDPLYRLRKQYHQILDIVNRARNADTSGG